MKKSLTAFSSLFFRSLTPRTVNKPLINLLTAGLFIGTFHQHFNSHQKNSYCSENLSSNFDYQAASKSTIVIYRHNKEQPVAAGIIIDENGLCLSVSHIYPRISEERMELDSFYAKVLGEETTYPLAFVDHFGDDNIMLFKLVKSDPNKHFQPATFTNEIHVGSKSYAIGKSPHDFNVIESGTVNEVNFNAKLIFGKEKDTSSFNIMSNIPNRNPTIFGGPLYDDHGKVIGMIVPFEEKLLPRHLLAAPYSFIEGIIKQYKDGGRVRRPYFGMSMKTAPSGLGVSVIQVSTDGPAEKGGVRLGDTVVEINDHRITNSNDFFKCIGYNLGQDFKVKLERDGKYRVVHIKSY